MLVINLIISLSVFNIINFLTSVFLRWIKQVEVLFLKAENVFCILSHSFFRRNIIVVLKMEEFQEEQRACYTLISKEVKMTHQNRAFWTFYIYIYISQHCVKHRWKVKRVINKAGMWFWWVSCTLIFRL